MAILFEILCVRTNCQYLMIVNNHKAIANSQFNYHLDKLRTKFTK